MALQVLIALDLNQNEIRNFLVQGLASDPGSPLDGQMWYNTTSHLLKFRNNGSTHVLADLNNSLSDFAAPNGDLSINSHKLTNVTDPGAAQDAATQHYVLGRALSDFNPPNGDVAWNSHKITGLADPTLAQDAATKNYVDGVAVGLDIHASVRVASTANLAVASAVVNGAVVDGITLATGDRILLKNQTTASENGVYIVAASGAASRASDMNTTANYLQGAFVFVELGTANGATGWIVTTQGSITVGTTSVTWTQFSAPTVYTAGAGLTLSSNQFAVDLGGVSTLETNSNHLRVKSNANTGQPLLSGGSGAEAAYGQLDLSDGTHAVKNAAAVANGGTGATTAAGAKTNLGFLTRYAASVGDGSSTSFVVNHALGTRDVHVQVYDNNSPYDQVWPEVQYTDANNVTVLFGSAPASNRYRVVCVG